MNFGNLVEAAQLPYAIGGYVVFLVFFIMAYVGKHKGSSIRKLFFILLALAALVGGLYLSYQQVEGKEASTTTEEADKTPAATNTDSAVKPDEKTPDAAESKEETKADEAKEEPKKEEAKTEEAKTEEPKTEEPKAEESK